MLDSIARMQDDAVSGRKARQYLGQPAISVTDFDNGSARASLFQQEYRPVLVLRNNAPTGILSTSSALHTVTCTITR